MAVQPTRTPQETEVAAAWVLRRVGFGATVDDLDHAVSQGLDGFLNELFSPDLSGVVEDGDPWTGETLVTRIRSREHVIAALQPWTNRMRSASRPVTEWLAWFWHGHLVSSLGPVRSTINMVNQIRLFRRLGGGPFGELLRAVTIDPAMLRYLDGETSTAGAPNENFSRELLELFALGLGEYTEADVLAGARALTGWVRDGAAGARFVPRRHDDTPQRYLGVSGVHDVDTVIGAVVSHPACGGFVARSLATAILGPATTTTVSTAQIRRFTDDDLRIMPFVRRLVEHGLAGDPDAVVLGPVPWTIAALRCTGAQFEEPVQPLRMMRRAGQVPMFPPNVSGWPSGEDWFTSSATAARLSAAQQIAEVADPDGPAMQAADSQELHELARALGRPEGFSAPTVGALDATGAKGRALLALALSSPDLVVA